MKSIHVVLFFLLLSLPSCHTDEKMAEYPIDKKFGYKDLTLESSLDAVKRKNIHLELTMNDSSINYQNYRVIDTNYLLIGDFKLKEVNLGFINNRLMNIELIALDLTGYDDKLYNIFVKAYESKEFANSEDKTISTADWVGKYTILSYRVHRHVLGQIEARFSSIKLLDEYANARKSSNSKEAEYNSKGL